MKKVLTLYQVTLPSLFRERAGEQIVDSDLSVGDLNRERGCLRLKQLLTFDPAIIQIDGISQAGTLTNGTAPINEPYLRQVKAVVSWACGVRIKWSRCIC